MDVRATAIRTIGIINEGDGRVYTYVKSIEDKGKYYNLVFSEYHKVRISKATWKLEIS